MSKNQPTLGQGGKGFQKRQLVSAQQVAVDPEDISKMQQGYETRIARQKEALDRMTDLLEQRTEDVAEHMRRANDMAALVVQGGLGMQKTTVDDDEVDGLLKLIPEGWDWYGEDDTARDALAKYIKWCTDEAEHQKAKQEAVVGHYNDAQEVWTYLRPFLEARNVSGATLLEVVTGLVTQLQRDLARAERDARANATAANAALKANAQLTAEHVGDIGADAEIPPDMRGEGQQAFTAPVEINRLAGVPTPLEVSRDADRETLSWDGMGDLAGTDDERPGRAF